MVPELRSPVGLPPLGISSRTSTFCSGLPPCHSRMSGQFWARGVQKRGGGSGLGAKEERRVLYLQVPLVHDVRPRGSKAPGSASFDWSASISPRNSSSRPPQNLYHHRPSTVLSKPSILAPPATSQPAQGSPGLYAPGSHALNYTTPQTSYARLFSTVPKPLPPPAQIGRAHV